MLTFWEKNNATFIIDFAWKKYSNAFILQKILHGMTPWVIGTQNALQGLIISNLKDSRIL